MARGEWRIANREGRPRLVILPIRYSPFAMRPFVLAIRPLAPPRFRRGGAPGKTNWQAFQGVRIGYHGGRGSRSVATGMPGPRQAAALRCEVASFIPAMFRSMRFIWFRFLA